MSYAKDKGGEMIEFDMNPNLFSTNIKVMGVGGAGGNAVNNMIEKGIEGVEFVVVNTDVTDLRKSKAKIKLQIGQKLTGGKGTGAKPELGKDAALESEEEIRKVLDKTDMLFIAAGFGGGTGTGAAPVVAEIAKEMDILTLGIITSPWQTEGKKRMNNFEDGLSHICQYIDSYIIIPNSKLKTISSDMLIFDVYKKADDIIYEAAKAMSDIINRSGYINVDFADVKSVLSNRGCALMGTGIAEGDDRAANAANAAISNPLLSDVKLVGCKSVLINVTLGDDAKYDEFEEISAIINNETGGADNTIIGLVHDTEMTGKICVTIFASGLPDSYMKSNEVLRRTHCDDTCNDLKDIFTRIKTTEATDIDNSLSDKKTTHFSHGKPEVDVPAFMRRFSD